MKKKKGDAEEPTVRRVKQEFEGLKSSFLMFETLSWHLLVGFNVGGWFIISA